MSKNKKRSKKFGKIEPPQPQATDNFEVEKPNTTIIDKTVKNITNKVGINIKKGFFLKMTDKIMDFIFPKINQEEIKQKSSFKVKIFNYFWNTRFGDSIRKYYSWRVNNEPDFLKRIIFSKITGLNNST